MELSGGAIITLLGGMFVTVFGSGFLGTLIMNRINKKDNLTELNKDLKDIKASNVERDKAIALIVDSLAANSYTILSQRLDYYIRKGYATAQDKREIEVLRVAYKAHNWNGDMDSRLEEFYALPSYLLNRGYRKDGTN